MKGGFLSLRDLAGLAVLLLMVGCSRTGFQPIQTLPAREAPLSPTIPVVPTKGDLLKAVIAKDQLRVSALLSQGSDINENLGSNGNDLTPLLAAISGADTVLALLLIEKGASAHASYGGFHCAEFSARVFGEGHEVTRRLRELRT